MSCLPLFLSSLSVPTKHCFDLDLHHVPGPHLRKKLAVRNLGGIESWLRAHDEIDRKCREQKGDPWPEPSDLLVACHCLSELLLRCADFIEHGSVLMRSMAPSKPYLGGSFQVESELLPGLIGEIHYEYSANCLEYLDAHGIRYAHTTHSLAYTAE